MPDLIAARLQFSNLSEEQRKQAPATSLQAALTLGEQALQKLEGTPCQSLIEQYARARQLLGAGSGLGGVVSGSQKATAQVCLESAICEIEFPETALATAFACPFLVAPPCR